MHLLTHLANQLWEGLTGECTGRNRHAGLPLPTFFFFSMIPVNKPHCLFKPRVGICKLKLKWFLSSIRGCVEDKRTSREFPSELLDKPKKRFTKSPFLPPLSPSWPYLSSLPHLPSLFPSLSFPSFSSSPPLLPFIQHTVFECLIHVRHCSVG